MLGQTISHYKILDKLGEGGMGVVYKAQDTKLNRTVALKFLPMEFTSDSEAVNRFINEAQAASSLDHANICTIHEIDETEDGRIFICMAYYDGETLRKKVTNNQLSVNSAIDIANQIAAGLQRAHEAGITHRDIKPENIIITTRGEVKIIDFGIAKLAGQSRLTKTGSTLGTLMYISPEQLRGEAVDHRADIWALGVVLYEMLAGQAPFRGEYEAALVYAIAHESYEPLTRYRPEIPDHLQRIADRALDKNPDTRYQSAVEVSADLQRLYAAPEIPLSSFSKSNAAIPNNLPTQLTSFIGREREIEEVRALLSTVRLVTLTGPGGTGKTRLGLQVAANILNDFESGVFFVALASISDPGLVASSVAQTLGVRDAGGRPILESLKDHLREKYTLILLDNFEHVVAAATFVTELLAICPKLKVLVTSREPLHIRGEQQFPVPPLTLPEPKRLPSIEGLSQYEAVALFVQRALAVKPDFVLTNENAPAVAQICIRLDGLPLAVELAAARSKLLSPQAILEKLEHRFKLLTGGPRDLPARQQSLRGAIEWSYALLDEEEKKLLRRLSVFMGGCTIEAAETVCDAATDPSTSSGRGLNVEVLDGLASLVDKSLLRQMEQPDGEPRFIMLETIREFGHECLAASGETAGLRLAHRNFFLKFAEEAEPQLTGPQQVMWFERLEREHDNLRAALEWSGTEPDGLEAALQLAGALWRFWLVRGYLSEGRKRLAELITLAGASSRTKALAKVITGAGTLAHNQGDYTAAGAFFEKSLALHRELEDKPGIAAALNNAGWVAFRRGDYGAARALSEESQALHRELGEKRGIAFALNNLGWVAHHQGDYTAARSFHQENLALRRELGDKRGIAFALNNLGWAIQKQGDYERAVTLLEEALALFREVGEKQLLAFALSIRADVAHEQGDNERAKALLDESLPLFREIGDKYGHAFALNTLGRAALGQGDHVRARTLFEESLTIRREIGDKWGIAQSLHRLGETAQRQGEDERAIALYNESLTLRKEMEDKSGIAESLEVLAEIAGQ